ncbi:tonB-system energizer ExbB [Rhizobium sp. Leaf341]|uniref:tonB-system energizer ExbB n=1 Tax=Rhizobium sp. Leaf341 TaxID=1736344 RepID=UPI001FCD5069|nr:tonB-system energizer ExbB [Rhizobium sp. Leaf341]
MAPLTGPAAAALESPAANTLTNTLAGPSPVAAPAAPTIGAAIAAIPAAEHDMTPLGMFYAADPVVKGVMILLAAASVMTWTILFMKVSVLVFAKRRMKTAIRTIRASGSLAEAGASVKGGAAARLLHEAADETAQSRGLPSEGIKERVHIALSRLETAISRRMAIGTGLLASIGSVGPFVGLFGTVWGIMRSFIGIANSNTTNLAVVAPGIAEALLATAIGLVAAIPAVIIYNALSRSIGSYRVMSGDVVALIMRHLSRDLDRQELSQELSHEIGQEYGMATPKSGALRVAAE